MWKKLIAVALTVPATMTIAFAQAPGDYDIQAYSQDLNMRLVQGQQLAIISPDNYNSLLNSYNQVEAIRRAFGNRPMNPVERTNVMNSLLNIDKYLTDYLHDDENARYNLWNTSTNTWRNNWWKNRAPINLKNLRRRNGQNPPPPPFNGNDRKHWGNNPPPSFNPPAHNGQPPQFNGGNDFAKRNFHDDHHKDGNPAPANPNPNGANAGKPGNSNHPGSPEHKGGKGKDWHN